MTEVIRSLKAKEGDLRGRGDTHKLGNGKVLIIFF
jgi:hypothetical protein